MQYHLYAACIGGVLAATIGATTIGQAHAEPALSFHEAMPISPLRAAATLAAETPDPAAAGQDAPTPASPAPETETTETTETETPEAPEPTDARPVAAKEGDEIGDERLAQAVTLELIQARGVPADDIDVDASEGVVTLRGAVDSLLAKERARTIAQRLRGVRAVVDLLEVQPSAIPDSTLQTNVERALSWDPAIEPPAITAEVEGGVVTLRGTADSWAAKQLAGAAARSVRGIAAVQNELEVQQGSPRTDTELRAAIDDRLRWDARLGDAGSIEADVQDGKATLRGSVRSAYDKRLAVSHAWVPGVAEVDATALEVNGNLPRSQRGHHRLAAITNEDIRGAVLAAFQHDPRVAPFAIAVDVQDGMVTLRGQVDNLKARRAATQGAANTAGVWHVVDLLQVRGGEAVDDEELAERVKQALGIDSYASHSDIAVNARNGVVTLRGDMESHFARWHAGDVATRVAGVRRVENRLDVDAPALVYQVPFHDWDPLTNQYDTRRPYPGFQSDRAIRENIERALWWSPYVDAAQIAVVVEDGTATLSGSVPSQMAQGAAAREAYQGGARRVVDRLTIEEPPAEEPPAEQPPAAQESRALLR